MPMWGFQVVSPRKWTEVHDRRAHPAGNPHGRRRLGCVFSQFHFNFHASQPVRNPAKRARFYDANLGRFHTLDEYEGRTGEPLSLHKYLYAHGNPVSGWDPSGRDITLPGVMTASAIGATIGLLAMATANYALGRANSLTSIVVGALFGAVAAPLAMVSPSVALGLAGYGLLMSSCLAIEVFMSESATTFQKVAASGLLLSSVLGAGQAIRFAQSVNYGVGVRQPIPQKILGDRSEVSFAAFVKANGMEWYPHVRLRSPFHSKGRDIDGVMMNPQTKEFWGIEIKASVRALGRKDAHARAQIASDTYTNRYGTEMYGANARAYRINGERVEGVIRIVWEP